MTIPEIIVELQQWLINNPDVPGQQRIIVHGAIKQLQRAIE